jgi:hypothetical protein
MTQGWSTDVPGLIEVQGINTVASGRVSVTVQGTKMGTVTYTGRGRGGNTGCETSEWVSETSVRCKVGQGVQGSRRSVVTAGARSGNVTQGVDGRVGTDRDTRDQLGG